MFRRIATAAAALALTAGALALAQTTATQQYVPPEGVEFQIHLYPISKFRGTPVILEESTPRIRRPIAAESILLTRGIWELCPDINYLGRCVRVSETRIGIPVALTVRSARLVGDTGPLFAETPKNKAGPDLPLAPAGEIVESRPAPAPVVAPTVEQGGEAGTNPSLAGREVEFFPSPARGGLRVLACSQSPSNPAPRCVQATADGFCAERGYRDSGWRESETINGKAYLANVLCKRAADSAGARDSSGMFSIFKN